MTNKTDSNPGSPTSAQQWGIAAFALGLFGLVLYISTASPNLQGGDNAEFATLFASPGVAHPPGFPAYVAWLRLCSLLGGSTTVFAAACTSAITGAGTLVALLFAARGWKVSIKAALPALVLLALSPQMWGLSTHVEVFSFNACVASLILLFASPKGPLRGGARSVVLGILAGIGLASHHSIVLMAPVGLLGLYYGYRESRWWWSALSPLAAALTLVSFYLWLSWTAEGALYAWGEVTTREGLVHHFLRADYGTTSLAAGDTKTNPIAHIGALAAHMAHSFLYVGPLLALVGMIERIRTSPRDGLLLAATFITSGFLFVSLFNLPTEGTSGYIIARFYLLPEVVLTLGVALGFDVVLKKVHADWQARVALALSLLVLASSTALSFPKVLGTHEPILDHYLHDLLAPLPPNAIVLGTGDHRVFGVAHTQIARSHRTDVLYIDPNLVHYHWYRAQIERKSGTSLTAPSNNSVDTVQLVKDLQRTGRDIFLANTFSNAIPSKFRLVPFGLTMGIVEQTPHPAETLELNLKVYSTFQQQPGLPAKDVWFESIQQDYARTWTIIGQSTSAHPELKPIADECLKQQKRWANDDVQNNHDDAIK